MWCGCGERGHTWSMSKVIWLTTTPAHFVLTASKKDRWKYFHSLIRFKLFTLSFNLQHRLSPIFLFLLQPKRGRLSVPQIQKLPAAVLDWRPFSRCSKQLSSALHHSVDSLLRSSSSLVNNNWGVGLSLENIGNAVLGGSRSDLAKFARSQHSVDKATFAIHEISCTYYR